MNTNLESLNLAELDILLAHLRLGAAHFEEQLPEEQRTHLLALGALNYEQLIAISSNRLEKLGNLALVINTVITSIFGAWMGFSGFMEMHLDSYRILCEITTLAVLASLTVGFINFRLTLKTAQEALHNQRIHNLQINTLKLVTNKEQERIHSLVKYLNNSLNYLVEKSLFLGLNHEHLKPNSFYALEQSSDYAEWFAELKNAVEVKVDIIEDEELYAFYSLRLEQSLDAINELINTSSVANTKQFPCSKNQRLAFFTSHNPLIRSLNHTNSKERRASIHIEWIKNNYMSLLGGIFPTLLGGFASMFVFLAGGPNLAKELGLIHVEHILKNPSARIIELSVAIVLTVYYGGSFVYNNYKNYIRDHEINRTRLLINKLEKEDVFLKMKMGLLNRIKAETKRIINIYTALEQLNKLQKIS